MARGNRFSSRTRVVAATVVALVATSVACGGAETREIAGDDDGLDGPLPTAPNARPRNRADLGAGDPFSGSVDVNDLIRRIDALTQEEDICTLLTGQALDDVTTADINLTSLASNPAGFSQLFRSLDTLFGHMRTIAPSELDPPLTELQRVWGGLASVDPRSQAAEAQASALIASPSVQSANDQLGVWVTANC